MKKLTLILMLMNSVAALAQDGKASTIRKPFSRQTQVSISIQADAQIIWSLLTNSSDFARWNSTIVSMKGDIQKNGKIELVSTLDPKRTFKPRVKEFDPETRMVWGDGKGNREFKLSQNSDGSTLFVMDEKIGGLMFPMYAKYIPPFDDAFENFARDLKNEAEIISTEQ